MLRRVGWARARTALLLGASFAVVGPMPGSWAVVTTSGCVAVDESCTLAELLGGGSLTVGQHRFENFEIERDSGGLDYTAMRVSGLDSAAGISGISIEGGGQWLVDLGDFLDLRIGYRARGLQPADGLASASLDLIAPVSGPGARLRVQHASFDLRRRHLGRAVTQLDADFDVHAASDAVDWPAEAELYGEVDLRLDAGRTNGQATLDRIEVRHALPEPDFGAVWLATIGLAAIASRLGREVAARRIA